MINSPEKYVERLIAASARKYDFLQELLFLTHEQSKNLSEEGIESLEKLVSEKQTRIDEIDKLDEEFNVYYFRLKQQMKVNSLEELKGSSIHGIKELQDLIGNIMGTVREIGELEKQNNKKVKELLDYFKTEIRKINQGKMANSAYNPEPVQHASYYIDKKK